MAIGMKRLLGGGRVVFILDRTENFGEVPVVKYSPGP